jgi:hypothetical protein
LALAKKNAILPLYPEQKNRLFFRQQKSANTEVKALLRFVA